MKQRLMFLEPMIAAFENNDLDLAWNLIQDGAHVDSSDLIGWTLFHHAAQKDRTDLIEKLIQIKGNINAKNCEGKTALTIAIEHRKTKVVALLLQNGADIEAKDREGMTPLMWAASKSTTQHLECLHLLLEKGALIEAQDRHQLRAIHHAAMRSNISALCILIKHFADINAQDLMGKTPVYYSVKVQSIDCLRALIAGKAKLNILNHDKLSPLGLAIFNNDPEMAQALINAGADVNPDVSVYLKPLYLAIDNGVPSIVNLLLSKGACCVDLLKKGLVFNKLHEKFAPASSHAKISRILSDLPMVEPLAVENELRSIWTHVTEIDDPGIVVLRSDFSLLSSRQKYTGYVPQEMLAKVLDSLHEYSSLMPHSLSKARAEMIFKAASASARFTKPTAEELFDQWVQGHPILVPGGLQNHTVYFLLWHDKYALCNRGYGNNLGEEFSQSYSISSFNPENLTPDIIDLMLRSGDDYELEQYLEFTLFLLPERLELDPDPLTDKLVMETLEDQTTGNCTYANAEGIISILNVMADYFHVENNCLVPGDKEIQEIVTKQASIMKNWRAFFTICTIKEYIDWIAHPSNPFIPDISRFDTAWEHLRLNIENLDPLIVAIYQELDQVWRETKRSIESQVHLRTTSPYELRTRSIRSKVQPLPEQSVLKRIKSDTGHSAVKRQRLHKALSHK
jgi:ankyrin repeat protein